MLLALLLSCVLSAAPASAGVQRYDIKASPFDAVRWENGAPEVQVGEVWYRPLAIDDVEVEAILKFCDGRWPGQREKRLSEDLVEALALMGWKGDLLVDLDLERLPDGKRVRLEGVEMTKEKRNALRDAAHGNKDRNDPPKHPAAIATVARAGALRDVDAFEAGLRERFSYLSLRGVDLAAELKPVREALGDPVDVRSLADSLHRVLMRFGDGHAAVQAPLPGGEPGDRFLPFLLVEAAEGIVAVEPDRSALVNQKRPVVQALDGRPLAEWIAAVEPGVAAGSPQLVRRRALRDLRPIDGVRRALGAQGGSSLVVTFTDKQGKKSEDRTLELAPRSPVYGDWPRAESRMLPGKVGYLRLGEMDDGVDALRAAMQGFAEARGLVVDVRGNGGGSRDLLLALAGYLIGPGEPAVVASVAAYRLAPAFAEDHLEERFMRRADWDGWSERQRAAIAAFAPTFKPEWTPPEAFSEWHYLVLDRTGDPAEYAFGGPVVVLVDAGCFSATDVFLGALELLPRVTLVGTPSSGGSARVQAFLLPETGIEVRCASMASFRPDGRLYDGRGVEVDEVVLPAALDFIDGGADAQLDAALRILGKHKR